MFFILCKVLFYNDLIIIFAFQESSTLKKCVEYHIKIWVGLVMELS